MTTGATVLAVDDEPANLELLEHILATVDGVELVTTSDPFRVPGLVREHAPDLVLLDVRMPDRDGFELYERLLEDIEGFERVPVVFLTAENNRDACHRALAMGARDYLTKPLGPAEVRLRIRNHLHTRSLQRSLEAMNRELEGRVRERTAELEAARVEILDRLALAAEYRDDQTGEHTRRVGVMSERVARALGLSEEEVECIRRAAPLHDIGKIGIRDSILLKAGGLDPEEFEVIKTHTTIGSQILSGSRFPLLSMAEKVARYHHENWDGSGYPEGLEGPDISPYARIVRIVDVFDSLTHRRVYKEAWPTGRALDYLEHNRASLFDPDMVPVFLTLHRGGELVAGAGSGAGR